MRSLTIKKSGLFLTAIGATIFTLNSALAHERRNVAEQYEFLIGFMDEPAYTEWKNAVSLRITEISTQEPVSGLEDDLQLTVTYADSDASQTLSLRTLYGDPGHYAADIVPTAPGPYNFRVFGNIGGKPIDETFGSQMDGGGFKVEPSAALAFP